MRLAHKRFGLLAVASTVVSLPAALFVQYQANTPVWYVLVSAVFLASGIGLFALAFGAVALFAGRARADGGFKAALGVAVAIGIFSSYSVIAAAIQRS